MAKIAESGATRSPRVRRLFVSLAVIPIAFLLVEGCASLLLSWRDSDGPGISEQAHCVYDPLLGWTNERGIVVTDHYGRHRTLSTNSRGFRANEEYTAEIPAGRRRIVCVGDSFTLGYGVDDRSTYEAWMERLWPEVQVVNMGQGGYGVDQAYLWYLRDGVELKTNLLLLVFIAPNFDRMLTDRFQGAYPKPRLRIENGELKAPEEPLPRDWESGGTGRRLGRFGQGLAISDFFARLRRRSAGSDEEAGGPLPYDDEARLLVTHLRDVSQERGQDFALVQLPLRDRRAGRAGEVSAWLNGVCGELEVPFLDLSADFDALPPGEVDDHYQADGHLNALGNRFVARVLLQRLAEHFPALR